MNGERLWRSLMELARIGATAKGGVRRLALTELDRQGRDRFVGWARAAAMETRVDAIGNLFARRPGLQADAPPVVMGSHLDSQPSGGKFDGAYGVLAGLEVIRTLNDAGIHTRAPLEVAAWTNEEGSRFTPTMMGSGVFAGAHPLEQVLAQKDLDGISVRQALESVGYAGTASAHKVGAYFEAHIEQGPVLSHRTHRRGEGEVGQVVRRDRLRQDPRGPPIETRGTDDRTQPAGREVNGLQQLPGMPRGTSARCRSSPIAQRFRAGAQVDGFRSATTELVSVEEYEGGQATRRPASVEIREVATSHPRISLKNCRDPCRCERLRSIAPRIVSGLGTR